MDERGTSSRDIVGMPVRSGGTEPIVGSSAQAPGMASRQRSRDGSPLGLYLGNLLPHIPGRDNGLSVLSAVPGVGLGIYNAFAGSTALQIFVAVCGYVILVRVIQRVLPKSDADSLKALADLNDRLTKELEAERTVRRKYEEECDQLRRALYRRDD